jgi:hypothetical protein
MFILDPRSGTRRRAIARDRIARAARRSRAGLEATGRDLGNRLTGASARVRARLAHDEGRWADDEVVRERVRSTLGHYTSHPGAIEVMSTAGAVTLTGPILSREAGRLLRAVRHVRGVAAVEDRLDRHDEPGAVPALQGGAPASEGRGGWTNGPWVPTARMLAGTAAASAALASAGYWARRH